MRRRIVLLLLLVSPSIYGMENNNHAMENNKLLMFLDSVKSNIIALLPKKSGEVSPMEALEISKNKFEKEIQLPRASIKDKGLAWAWGESREGFMFGQTFFRYFSKKYPDGKSPYDFLKYCYYQQYHRGQGESNLKELVECSDLFDLCQKSQIDGFSALGAALLAKNVGAEKRYKFLELLMHHGFDWTENDRALIALKFYDTIPLQEKQTMVLLLGDRKEDNLFMLPHEVRKYIVGCMVSTCESYDGLQRFLFGLKLLK